MSGANNRSSETNASAEGAMSTRSKTSKLDQIASVENSVTSLHAVIETQNVFTLGVNCDAESLYNKDPKDANKYEIEGQKV